MNGLGYSFTQAFSGPDLPRHAAAAEHVVLHHRATTIPTRPPGGSISSSVKLLDSFGKTRVLSSPKLMVINNQTAVLKVVDNQVYFTVKADTVTNQSTSTTTFTTTQNVVPVGFIMNVTPQISESDMVTLDVRPTVTRIIDTVKDPNPSLAAANVTSLIPITQTREMESVLKVASGQTAVLGGLMLDSFEGKREGLPLASRIPVFGDLFSNRNDRAMKSRARHLHPPGRDARGEPRGRPRRLPALRARTRILQRHALAPAPGREGARPHRSGQGDRAAIRCPWCRPAPGGGS